MSKVTEEVKGTIKYYAGAAAAIGAAPIPGSDAVLLSGLQMKMTRDILSAYGINVGLGMLVEEVVKAKVVSMLGKAVAGNLIKMIPGVGSVVGGAINASVASSITYAMGRALVKAAEIIRGNGWESNPDKVAYTIRTTL